MGLFVQARKADVFIGQSAGKQLLKAMQEARSEVKIVSPYLSASLVRVLVDLHEKGVQVSLVTSDERLNDDLLRMLLVQRKHEDQTAIASKRVWLPRLKIAWWVITLAVFMSLIWTVPLYSGRQLILPALCSIAWVLIARKQQQFARKPIFYYDYEPLFPLRIFFSPHSPRRRGVNSYFIHSKIFVIDKEVAYLGSVNYTWSGFEKNHETRIRFTEPAVVNAVSEEVNRLMHEADLTAWDVPLVGRSLYAEPPY